MGSWVYKKMDNGEVISDLVDALHVPSAFAAGFTANKSGIPNEISITEDDNKPTLEQLRAKAEEKGIVDFDKKRTASLRKELGYDD